VKYAAVAVLFATVILTVFHSARALDWGINCITAASIAKTSSCFTRLAQTAKSYKSTKPGLDKSLKCPLYFDAARMIPAAIGREPQQVFDAEVRATGRRPPRTDPAALGSSMLSAGIEARPCHQEGRHGLLPKRGTGL
jgi:hypothetical protein